MRYALIDLGTNTFHLLIVEADKTIVYRESKAVRLGQGGINQNTLLPEAQERALTVLKSFRSKIDEMHVPLENTTATGTSAIRNAENKSEFLEKVLQETGLEIQVISGDEEAQLIYEGVKQAVNITENSLIMDIGGGSVEFIIASKDTALWQQSFEIGGQRLMDRFMKTDPISPKAIERIDDYLREVLLPLANAIHQYRPAVLIGSSGSFDTLLDMHWLQNNQELPPASIKSDEVPVASFYTSYEQFIMKNRAERLAIPGMIDLRVDLIVVSSCLIRYLLQTFGFTRMVASRYALKEGLMSRSLAK